MVCVSQYCPTVFNMIQNVTAQFFQLDAIEASCKLDLHDTVRVLTLAQAVRYKSAIDC